MNSLYLPLSISLATRVYIQLINALHVLSEAAATTQLLNMTVRLAGLSGRLT
jgi:hypothetical protein